jgi:putative DNA primase/helicase
LNASPWLIEEIDKLRNAHGGGASHARERAADAGAEFDGLGLRIDGRERRLRDIAWALVVGLYREALKRGEKAPPRPSGKALDAEIRAAFTRYERDTKSRLPPTPGLSNADLLEREGRGLSALRERVRRALEKWETEVREAALESLAEEGWTGPAGGGDAGPEPHDDPPGEADNDPHDLAPEFSEEALALDYAARHERRLRYVPAWGGWMVYDSRRWAADGTLRAQREARRIAREAARRTNESGPAKKLASANTAAAIERLARADGRLAATTDIWDPDPMALNTPGGVIDLRTGHKRQHDPADHLTKITSVTPDGDCPLWLSFLYRITAGDQELVTYLQRTLGYMLTGDISRQELFFAYGVGANGKSVLVSTVAAILGDYHCTAPIETFTESLGERHPTELARLVGARLVTCVETDPGRRWAESRIKALTGGDKIAARFMRRDFFEFTPQFKLLIAGNHKPSLRSVDEAIRRRFRLIPFAVTIPPDERDPHLVEKLRAEHGGILQWMVDGCLDWQREGPATPEAVARATDAYLDAEDALGSWLAECCEQVGGHYETTRNLYESWKTWAEAGGEFVGTERSFAQALQGRGFASKRSKRTRGFTGLRIIPKGATS